MAFTLIVNRVWRVAACYLHVVHSPNPICSFANAGCCKLCSHDVSVGRRVPSRLQCYYGLVPSGMDRCSFRLDIGYIFSGLLEHIIFSNVTHLLRY